MNQEQFEIQIKIAAAKAKLILMQSAPVRTGNLMRSIKMIYTSNGFKIYVDQKQAPYMPFTEEKWKSPRWRGRANPNEGWFEDATRSVAKSIAAQFGTTTKEK